jgi:hypothetical protein
MTKIRISDFLTEIERCRIQAGCTQEQARGEDPGLDRNERMQSMAEHGREQILASQHGLGNRYGS